MVYDLVACAGMCCCWIALFYNWDNFDNYNSKSKTRRIAEDAGEERMTLINLKFAPEMEELVLQGKKCCTTRDEPKGEVGDLFVVKNRVYRIISVTRENYSLSHYFGPEGFKTFREFADCIRNIYKNCDDIHTWYIHFFAYVGEVE
jgi:hypothetical protein